MAKLPVPFIGQMRCISCGKEAHGPEYAGGWRAIDGDGHRYYACPDCHPADSDRVEKWQEFYALAGLWLFNQNHQRPMKKLVFWREVNGQAKKMPL